MLLKICLLFITVFISIISAEKDVGEKCIPNHDELDGVCTLTSNCAAAMRQIKETRSNHNYSRCGFIDLEEIVCCPTTTTKFGNTAQTTGSINGNSRAMRIADEECQKIIASSKPPLALHIIGGEEAMVGEFPHMVALGYEGQFGYRFDCGGSLISNRFVMTAAHCVDTADRVTPSIARIGVVDLNNGTFDAESDVRIQQIYQHPNYSRSLKYHDIALLKLEKAVRFDTNQNAACLYTKEIEPTNPLTITGWGTTNITKDARSNTLLKANVTIIPRAQCSESYTTTKWRKLPSGIIPQQICAGDANGLHDTCQGDSGGPLQSLTEPDGHPRLVGVTSFGRGCGSGASPGVYTRVSLYLDWIESVVWAQ